MVTELQNNQGFSDMLQFLGIDSVFFDFDNGMQTLLRPEKINGSEWICITNTELSSFGKIKLQMNDSTYVFKIMTELLDSFIHEYKITFLEKLPEPLAAKLEEYNKLVNSIERRKEERFDIGLKHWQDFNLKSADQMIYFHNNNSLKCIFNNVSVHGAMITGESSELKPNEDVIKLSVIFADIDEAIMQPAVICRISHKSKELFCYSLKFLEPLSLAWQKQIELFASKLEQKKHLFF